MTETRVNTLMVTSSGNYGMLHNNKIHLNCQFLGLGHSIKEHGRFGLVCSSSLSGGGNKMKLRVKKKGKQSSSPTMMVALNEGHEAISEESTTVKLSALVAVRNSKDNNKVFANEIVNNLLTIFWPQNQTKGVVLQLVSTQLDPSTWSLQFILFNFFFFVYLPYSTHENLHCKVKLEFCLVGLCLI